MATTLTPNNPVTHAELAPKRQAFDEALDEIQDKALAYRIQYYIQKLAKFLMDNDGKSYDVAMLSATVFFAECVSKGAFAKCPIEEFPY